jgi:hypothetical protein
MLECGSSAYLYGSGHVSPLTVFHWLIRMEPFTSLHVETQNGRFDHASRVFGSIRSAFHLAMTAINHYVELVPEFFCCPSFLVNLNDYDLGVFREKRVNNVELPAWADSPMDFIYKHRQALESAHVTANLHSWIDLMWGSRQEGDPMNEFHPYMYESIWSQEESSDPVVRESIESFMQQCGQIPLRLFQNPHPKCPSPVVTTSSHPVALQLDCNLVKAGFCSRSESELVFFGIADGNVVCRLKYGLKTSKCTKDPILTIEPANAILFFNGILFTGSSNGQVVVIDLGTHEQSQFVGHIGRVN